MTNEEAKEILISTLRDINSDNDGFAYTTEQFTEAMLIAIESLSKSSLPSNLDDAAVKYQIETYGPRVMGGANVLSDEEYMQWNKNKDFIAGARWMAEQGETLEVEVKEDAGGYPYIPSIELYDYDKDEPLSKSGDKVVVQIRKK